MSRNAVERHGHVCALYLGINECLHDFFNHLSQWFMTCGLRSGLKPSHDVIEMIFHHGKTVQDNHLLFSRLKLESISTPDGR
jgi:hypothetical protein